MAVPLREDSQPRLDHLRTLLAEQTTRLDTFVGASDTEWDDDELRCFRVAIRRLRSLLRAARPLLDEPWADDLRVELGWLGKSAGPARDLDVLLSHLRETTTHFDPGERFVVARPLQQLEHERAAAREALVETIRSDRCSALLDRLAHEVSQAPPGAGSTLELQELAGTAFRRLRRAARRLGRDATSDELHHVRLCVKRSRYAAELAELEVGKPATRYVGRAKALQDILGAHQDAVVAEMRIRQLLGTPQSARWAVAGGRLIEHEFARRETARVAWPAAWWQLEKQGRATWGPIRR